MRPEKSTRNANNVPGPGSESATVKRQRSLLDRLCALRKKPNQCDVTLECTGGKKVYAHEFVLKATIPFFECLFNSDFEEAKTRRVVFPYIPAQAMNLILDHVYNGELKRITAATTAIRIISVAHMFQLTDLHQHCLNVLVTDFQPNTCFQLAKIADVYGSYCLKIKVMDYLTINHFSSDRQWDYHHARLPHLMCLMKFASTIKLVSLDKLFLEVLHFLSTKVKIEDRKLWACELMKCVDINALSEDCIKQVKLKELVLTELGIGPMVEEFSKSKSFYNADPGRSIANIRLVLHQFSKIKRVKSELVKLKHCSWGLLAKRSSQPKDDTSTERVDWLSLHLTCDQWNEASPETGQLKLLLAVAISIVNHNDHRVLWSKKMTNLCGGLGEIGFSTFAPWNEYVAKKCFGIFSNVSRPRWIRCEICIFKDVLNSTKGFIKDDVVVLDAYFVCISDH